MAFKFSRIIAQLLPERVCTKIREMAPEYELVHTENQKVYSAEGIAFIVAEAQKQGKTVGLVTGCFDILHIGHIDLFRQAKQNVDILIVGVDRDETVRLKGSNHLFGRLCPIF